MSFEIATTRSRHKTTPRRPTRNTHCMQEAHAALRFACGSFACADADGLSCRACLPRISSLSGPFPRPTYFGARTIPAKRATMASEHQLACRSWSCATLQVCARMGTSPSEALAHGNTMKKRGDGGFRGSFCLHEQGFRGPTSCTLHLVHFHRRPWLPRLLQLSIVLFCSAMASRSGTSPTGACWVKALTGT